MITPDIIEKQLTYLLKKESAARAKWQSAVAADPLEAIDWISGGLKGSAVSAVLEQALEASKHRTPQELVEYALDNLVRLGQHPPHSTAPMDLWIWAYKVAGWATVVRELQQLGCEE